MKNFNRTLSFITVLLVLLTAVVGCSGTKWPDKTSVDPASTAKTLAEKCKFSEVPAVVTTNEDVEFTLSTVLGIDTALIGRNGDTLTAAAGLCASTPEAVIVIKAVDAESANKINDGAIKKLTETYIHDYSNYGPEEISKVETCVNRVIGEYVFLVISADNTAAEQILNELVNSVG